MRASMQLREGTGREVFFVSLKNYFKSNSVDKSLDKRKLFRVRSSNASRLSHECFLSFPIAANQSELFFLIDSFAKCSRARGVN